MTAEITRVPRSIIRRRAILQGTGGLASILALGKGRKIRFVTHSQVDDQSVHEAIEAMAAILHQDHQDRSASRCSPARVSTTV